MAALLCVWPEKGGFKVQFSNVHMTSVADLLIYISWAQVPGLHHARGDLSVKAAGKFKEWNSWYWQWGLEWNRSSSCWEYREWAVAADYARLYLSMLLLLRWPQVDKPSLLAPKWQLTYPKMPQKRNILWNVTDMHWPNASNGKWTCQGHWKTHRRAIDRLKYCQTI
jgi:hypothetical protein